MVEQKKSLKQRFFERCRQLNKAWSTVTSIYLHVQQKSPASNRSPLDLLRV